MNIWSVSVSPQSVKKAHRGRGEEGVGWEAVGGGGGQGRAGEGRETGGEVRGWGGELGSISARLVAPAMLPVMRSGGGARGRRRLTTSCQMVRQHAGVKAESNGINTGGGGGGVVVGWGENCEKIIPHIFRGRGKSYFHPFHVKRGCYTCRSFTPLTSL